MKHLTTIAAALLLALVGLANAGTTNLDSLTLSDDLIVSDTTTLSGSTSLGGAVTFSSTIDFGSAVPSLVTSRSMWIGALEMHSTGAVELKNGKATWAIADTSADEFVYGSFVVPDDMDDDSHLFFQVVYLCDQASPTEGEFNISFGELGDDDADAALTALGNLLDTSPAQNDWSVTSIGAASTVDAASVTPGEYGFFSIGHDVTDQFCGGADINVAGVLVSYTSDQISN